MKDGACLCYAKMTCTDVMQHTPHRVLVVGVCACEHATTRVVRSVYNTIHVGISHDMSVSTCMHTTCYYMRNVVCTAHAVCAYTNNSDILCPHVASMK